MCIDPGINPFTKKADGLESITQAPSAIKDFVCPSEIKFILGYLRNTRKCNTVKLFLHEFNEVLVDVLDAVIIQGIVFFFAIPFIIHQICISHDFEVLRSNRLV
jgi:hypothetical protein